MAMRNSPTADQNTLHRITYIHGQNLVAHIPDYRPPHHADSHQKGPIIPSLDVIFVESKNNSQVSGDLRRHVPHVTSLSCDIYTQHHHICIVDYWFCALMFSLFWACTIFVNNSRVAGVKKHHHVLFCIYFHSNFKVHKQIIKFLSEINHDYNLIKTDVPAEWKTIYHSNNRNAYNHGQ